MALKECIRNRALSVINNDMSIHIPYRNSKLTLLLKDSFELFSNKRCKTVVIANVGPSISDLAMTKNTLRFVTPIKVGAKQKANTAQFDDPDSPANWTNQQLRDWLESVGMKKIKPDLFCPHETGK